MSLVCEDLATKAELQELKDQLNSLLGKVANGQPINVIAQGNFEGTVIGQQLEFAENSIQDIELHDSSGNKITEVNDSVLQNIVDGVDGFVKLKGLSTYAPLGFVNNQSKAYLKTLLRNKNVGKVATSGAKVSGTSIAVLSSLASIVASLGLNIATVRILGFRVDQIEKTVHSWNQDYTNLIHLQSKNNDNYTKTNIELQKAKQIIKDQQVQIDELNNEVLQANEAIADLSNLVNSAFEQIEALKAENVALKAELEAFESEVTEDIEQLKTITTQLETDLEESENKFNELLATTQKLGEDMANLQGKMTELQVTINDLILQNSVNIAEINLLKKEVAQNKVLTDSKLKNLEARLILAQHSLKSGTSGGGGFPKSAQQELVSTQMKTLELMNTLAQNPLAPSALNIETYQLGTGNPFPDLFNQILPQIPINNLEITPLQFEQITNSINETIGDKFAEIGIETMKGDLTQVKENTTPEKQKQNVKEGVCEQTQPDKCLSKNIKQPLEEKLNQVQNNINVNILGIPDLFPNACDETLAKVTELQESLEKAWNSTTEDKKINALNNIILLHSLIVWFDYD